MISTFKLINIPINSVSISLSSVCVVCVVRTLKIYPPSNFQLHITVVITTVPMLQEGRQKKTPEFVYKKLCIYPYMFKLQSPSKYSALDATHLLRCVFHCSKQFLNSSILMLFGASAIFFLFHLFQIGKTFPFENFFHLGKPKKKSLGARMGDYRGWAWESCHFWVKNC